MVVVLGLPKAGCQDADGEWIGVGVDGVYTFSSSSGNRVDLIHFNIMGAKITHSFSGIAMPSFDN